MRGSGRAPGAREPVLLLTGPPGAGKTTVADLLARRRPRAVHLRADLFFDAIAAGFLDPSTPASREQNEVVMGVVARAAAGYADGGYATMVDGIILPRWFLGPLRDALHHAGHAVAYAVLRRPLETCLARAADRTTQAPADPAVVERLWRDFADLGPLERHALELGDASPDASADALDARLADGALLL
jgi:predicted kinase